MDQLNFARVDPDPLPEDQDRAAATIRESLAALGFARATSDPGRQGSRASGRQRPALRAGSRPARPGWADPACSGQVADRAVDALAEQVRVAVVPRVLLDHVDQDPSHRDGLSAPRGARCRPGREPPRSPGSSRTRPSRWRARRRQSAVSTSLKSASGSASLEWRGGTSSWARVRRNQERSTPAMCRRSPSSDSVEGSTARRRICSTESPEHFRASVARCHSRKADQGLPLAGRAREGPVLGGQRCRSRPRSVAGPIGVGGGGGGGGDRGRKRVGLQPGAALGEGERDRARARR